MRNFIQKEKKEKAFGLRMEGKSYGEIRELLGIKSKGTLSYWFKNLKLDDYAKERLRKNTELAQARGLFRFNQERTKRIQIENKISYEAAKKEIKTLKRSELFLLGVALYWGEGAKIREKMNCYRLEISNTDPNLIKLFLRFIREVLNVDEGKIRAGIQIHKNIGESEVRRFWAEKTKLRADSFFITNQASSASRFKRPKNFLPHGTAVVRVNGRQLAYKMKGYIDALSAQDSGK
ncbi:hypothetical protein A2755_00430 [Candidatus Wolfebacteria bacterium RIFCSPHIGHO2_01_FULL_48_22]|uniref:Uncharacterized protein n=2 Tax=Candidatus Wolfeibacteriota TaxID=1752735 RepID=A0A1F8DVJ9_9BACT|nr:MAG: hypothetical protein A2755_00430 [Candidatus Wolfebacteria bacterium RIFCSPHIGHO2_01_FULL_48_22]OGM93746.1 MAG: hypothetical protein A2935_03095 [Candidatus Wolfebacteria bacterium RIFCSPLOWO2_01_FULL_47_17b]